MRDGSLGKNQYLDAEGKLFSLSSYLIEMNKLAHLEMKQVE